VNILAKNVDFLKKHDIFLHNSRIFLFMDILVLLEHLSQIIHIVFKVLALIGILAMKVSISLLILDLFFDILFVKADDSFLELLEISNMMEALEDIVLELLLEALLFIKLLPQMSDLICQTFLSHTQIVHDKRKILVNTIEMLELLTHLISLLIQFLNLDLTGSNITLEFLNLVVEDELELFKLLGLLFEIVDSLVFIADGSLTLLDLTFL